MTHIDSKRGLLGLFGLTLLLRIPSFVRPIMDIDECSYAAIACRMLSGGLPYRDGVENKFPAIYYVYHTTFALFGRNNMLAIHLLVALTAFCTALVCGAIARRLGTPRAGFLSALFYVLFSTFYYPKMQAGNTEMFLVLPASLAVWLQLRARDKRALYLAAGAMAALALAFKQVGGLMVAVLMAERLYFALRNRQLGRAFVDALLIASGWIAVVAAIVFYLRGRGILDDAVFWTWTYALRHYIPAGTQTEGFFYHLVTAFLPFTLCMAPLWLWGARVKNAPLAWIWLVAMIAAAFVGGRMYGHYFLLTVPPLALLGGLGADLWLERASKRSRNWVTGLIAGATLGFFVAGCLVDNSTGHFWRAHPDYTRVTDYVRKTTDPSESIFVWGWFPALYVGADRCPSTRFVYTHIMTAGDARRANWHNVPEAMPLMMSDLEKAPPRLVLDTSAGDYNFDPFPPEKFPLLWSFIEKSYEVDRTIEGVRIFRRK